MPKLLSVKKMHNSLSNWQLVSQDPELGVPSPITIKTPFRIGRREGFDLCLDCRNVSGLHAELLEEGGNLFINDLRSTNGTFVNDEKIRVKTCLAEGDQVQIGKAIFSVTNSSSGNPNRHHSRSERVSESTEDRFERLLVDGVVPFFQPVQNLNGPSNEIVGYEVLGRSRLFGLKTPDQMFAVATDLEKESELSRTLRSRGIEAAHATLPENLKLFFNTHPAELDCEEIEQSLEVIRATFPKREILLELPEQVLYTPDVYHDLFDSLRELDVKVVICDFGAGQIRLAELNLAKPDIVKFDCALTHGIDKAEAERKRLVSAMAKMVTELGIAPMAEYVETADEHEALKEMGFQLAQGFYYGHAVSIETLGANEKQSTPANTSNARPLDILGEAETPQPEIRFDGEPDDGLPELSIKPLGDCDGEHLFMLDPETFTLQLMFSTSQVEAEDFAASQKPTGDYRIYRKFGSNHEWYVVVFGVYDDRDSAEQDKSLFENTGHSCWVRKMSDVHHEIESAIVSR